MDTLSDDRKIIRAIISDFAAIPNTYDDVRAQAVCDEEGDHDHLMQVGWDREGHRVRHRTFHVDLIDGKFWVQHDATDRPIALELVAADVPKGRIVLGFREPKIRPHTGYAVA